MTADNAHANNEIVKWENLSFNTNVLNIKFVLNLISIIVGCFCLAFNLYKQFYSYKYFECIPN